MDKLDLEAPEEKLPESVEAPTLETESEGSAPETGSADGSEQNQEAQAPDVPKGWKWDGNVDALPDEFKERGRGMLRHFTERSEKLAEQQRQLEQQVELLKQAQSKPEKPPEPSNTGIDPREEWLRREYQDAYENGDTQKLWQVNNQLTDYRLQKQLQAIEPEYRKIVEESRRASAEVKNSLYLKEFGEKNPRLWVYKEMGIAEPIVREYCDRQGKPLDEAYKKMQEFENRIIDNYKRSLNQTVQEQKKATSAMPTTPMETKFVYVNSDKEANKLNIQFAMERSEKIAVVKKT